jgi:hypothetical protein
MMNIVSRLFPHSYPKLTLCSVDLDILKADVTLRAGGKARSSLGRHAAHRRLPGPIDTVAVRLVCVTVEALGPFVRREPHHLLSVPDQAGNRILHALRSLTKTRTNPIY